MMGAPPRGRRRLRRVGRRSVRRAFLLAAAVAAATQPLAAQVSFSAVAGLNRAAFSGPGSAGASSRNGLMIGGAAEVPVTAVFSVRPELQLSTKGARVLGWLGTRGYGNFSLAYVQAPLLGQIRAPVGAMVRPLLYGGASVGLLVACSLAARDCADLDEFDGRTADVSIVWGAEVEFLRVAVGVRYEAGLASVNARARNAVNNGVWSVTARYAVARRPARESAPR